MIIALICVLFIIGFIMFVYYFIEFDGINFIVIILIALGFLSIGNIISVESYNQKAKELYFQKEKYIKEYIEIIENNELSEEEKNIEIDDLIQKIDSYNEDVKEFDKETSYWYFGNRIYENELEIEYITYPDNKKEIDILK